MNVVPRVLYKTVTTVSTEEITQVLTKGQQLLADLAIANGYHTLYGDKQQLKCVMKQLYLYLYAIQSWDTTACAINYFDQTALMKIMSKVEQLFYICNFKPAC